MKRGSTVSVLVAVIFILALLDPCQGFKRRRIRFKRCSRDVPMPKAVFATCANSKGICEVRKGHTHNVRVVFVANHNTNDVDSHVRWNTWLEIPLPNQNRDACDGSMKCPVVKNTVKRFKYKLPIEDFWPRKVFPVIWNLRSRDKDEDLLCFRIQINIM